MVNIIIQVRKIDGATFPIEVDSDTTIDALKRLIGKLASILLPNFQLRGQR
jgi:hypothetical protein